MMSKREADERGLECLRAVAVLALPCALFWALVIWLI